MMRIRLLLAVALVSSAPAALAQSEVSDVVEGAGIKVGEGTVLHPVLGVESGIIYNVFYEDGSEGPSTAGLLRVIGEMAVGSLPPERMQAPEGEDEATRSYGDFAFRGELSAAYEEYLTGQQVIRTHRNLAVSALARGLVFPHRPLQLAFSDEFRRETRVANFESAADTNRDINKIGVEIRYRPTGRSLSGALRYHNTIDYFEDEDQQFANRISHVMGLQIGWQWLPVTRLYADASLGFVGPFGDRSTRPNSMPLRLTAGIQSAITVKTSVSAKVGYGKGFYETGPDFTNITGGLHVGYWMSQNGRMSALYEYDFQDSINANFYTDHAFALRMQQFIDRIRLDAAAELRLRHYGGVIPEAMGTTPDRDDLIISVPLGVTYNFRQWIAATLDYRFAMVSTDFRAMPDAGGPLDDPSYARHVLMAGVRAAY